VWVLQFLFLGTSALDGQTVNMESIYFTKHYEETGLISKFENKLSFIDAKSFFNPSFYIDDNLEIIVIRVKKHCPTKERPGKFKLLSYLIVNGKIFILDSLWNNIERIYDCKIFKLNSGIYLTFNTATHKNNKIYVAKIYPDISEPQEVIFKNRKEIEKNWAFYELEGELYCLYSVSPMVILRHIGNWEFIEHFNDKTIKSNNEISIGTQLSNFDDGFVFVAHEKLISQINSKFYSGKFCYFNPFKNDISIGKKNWYYDISATSGAYVRQGAWGVTYFSGIQKCGNNFRTSYGINDRDWSMSLIPVDALGLSL